MLFNSVEYMFLFLPIVFVGYWVLCRPLPRSWRVSALILASLVFYSWYVPKSLLLFLPLIVINYALGMALRRWRKKWLLTLAIMANCLPLVFFKYTDFILSTVAELISWFGGGYANQPIGLALPLGISYFTFVQIAYVVDAYRGFADVSFVDYAFSVSFWPKLIAGPIVRQNEVVPQLSRKRFLNFNSTHVCIGLLTFAIGLGKKVLLADPLGGVADWGWSAHASALDAASSWLVTVAYTLQLYFDFSGYCDMAWGVALLFNIKLPVNFMSPYKADSIQDFWRRWHISLSRWLRDYLYFSFGGSRCSLPKTLRNVFLTFLIGGIWHGAGWTFIAWGALHGIALSACNLWRKLQPRRLPRLVGWALTIVFVHFAWIFFRAPDVKSAFSMIAGMFGAYSGIGTTSYDWGLVNAWFVYVVLIVSIAVLPCPNSMQIAFYSFRKTRRWTWQIAGGCFVAVLVFGALLRMLAKNVVSSPFVYSQF